MWADPTTLRTPVGAAEKPHAPLMGGVDGGVVAADGDDNGGIMMMIEMVYDDGGGVNEMVEVVASVWWFRWGWRGEGSARDGE
ncbi:hypothetical protein Tco_0402148 [Tanacetum coccineum]